MKHIRKFDTLSEYNQAKAGSDFFRPCISMVGVDGQIYFDPIDEPIPPTIEMVDLDLPSGTLWSKYLIGVDPNNLSTAEDYIGTPIAWGELETKNIDSFNWGTYELGDKQFNSNSPSYKFKKYNDSTHTATGYTTDNKKELDALDDIASITYGPEYHIPTTSQIYELLEETTLESTRNYNGISGLSGIIAHSKTNQNSLFIPSFNNWYSIRLFSKNLFEEGAGKYVGTPVANLSTVFSDIDDYPELDNFDTISYLRHSYGYYFAVLGDPPVPPALTGYNRITSLNELQDGDKVVITSLDGTDDDEYAIIVTGQAFSWERLYVEKKSLTELDWDYQTNKTKIELTYVKPSGPGTPYFINTNYNNVALKYGTNISSYYYYYPSQYDKYRYRLYRDDSDYRLMHYYHTPSVDGYFEELEISSKSLNSSELFFIYKKYQ